MAKETMLVIAFIATSERKWTLCDLWDIMKKKVFENLYVRRKDSLRDLSVEKEKNKIKYKS
jgi:hypothetical protein